MKYENYEIADLIRTKEYAPAGTLDNEILSTVSWEHHEILSTIMRAGLVHSTDKTLRLMMDGLEKGSLNFNELLIHSDAKSITDDFAELLLKAHTELPESLIRNFLTFSRTIINNQFKPHDHPDETLFISVLGKLNSTTLFGSKLRKNETYPPTRAQRVFGSLTNAINIARESHHIHVEPFKLTKPRVFFSILNLLSLHGYISKNPNDELNALTQSLEALLSLNIERDQWVPFLTVIPQLRGTPFIQDLLSKPINYNVYVGITPVDLLLRAADKLIDPDSPNEISTQYLDIFNDMLARGLSLEATQEVIALSGVPAKRPYAWNGESEVSPHAWMSDKAFSERVFAWGVMGCMPEDIDVTGDPLSKNLEEAITKGAVLSRHTLETLKAIASHPEIRETNIVARQVNALISLLSVNEVTDGMCVNASAFFREAGWIQKESIRSKKEFLTAILAGPAFEVDRNAVTITKHNVLSQILYSLKSELMDIAVMAGHDLYRELPSIESIKPFTFGSANNVIADLEDHPAETFINHLENDYHILKAYEPPSQDSESRVVSFSAAVDVLLRNLPQDIDTTNLYHLMSTPKTAESLIRHVVVDFSRDDQLEPLPLIFNSSWKRALINNEHQDTLKSILKLAIEAGHTPRTLQRHDGAKNKTLETLLMNFFGDAGLAIYNAALIEVNYPSTEKPKRRISL